MALRRHATIKMCRDPRHTFIFHAPEGRASYAAGVLHVPQARFICGAQRRFSPPLCKVRTTATKCGSRLPCVRGGGKTEGFDGGVVSPDEV